MNDRELLIHIIEEDRRRFDSVLSALLNLEARRLDAEEKGSERIAAFQERMSDTVRDALGKMLEAMKPQRPIADLIKFALRNGEITAEALRTLAEDSDDGPAPPEA